MQAYYDHIDTLQQILDGISAALGRPIAPRNIVAPSSSSSNQHTDHNSNSINNENLSIKANENSMKNVQREIVQSYIVNNPRSRTIEVDFHSLTSVNQKVTSPVTPFNRPSTLPRYETFLLS